MRILRIITMGALVLLLPACYAGQHGIPSYVNIINNGGVGRSGIAESSDMVTGKACATSYLGYFAFGDASIRAAAREQGINSIGSVSHTTEGILGFTAEYCTIVRGWK